MSEVKSNSIAKAWAPPVFPVSGRLPSETSVVTANYKNKPWSDYLVTCATFLVWLWSGRFKAMKLMMRKSLMQGLCGLLALMLFGCSSADNEMAGGNIQAVNHTLSAINWFSVNDYRAHGGGGSSCCIIMPTKWRPGLKANVEWEVDPDPFAKIKKKTTGYGFDEKAWAEHEAKFQRHSATVDIPEWLGTKRCGLTVHFLVCNQVKVTTSCWGYGSPNNPIKEPKQMKEPAVCPK